MLNPSDRSGLIEIAARLAPTPACRRAFVTGKVEVLGGFVNIPPGTLVGWILAVTTKRGSLWHVAVIADTHQHTYRARLQADVFWQCWVGDLYDGNDAYSIYLGDHPEVYHERRIAALTALHAADYPVRSLRRAGLGDRTRPSRHLARSQGPG
jgi:hypothetical protein